MGSRSVGFSYNPLLVFEGKKKEAKRDKKIQSWDAGACL
jgi:hypothetical protein